MMVFSWRRNQAYPLAWWIFNPDQGFFAVSHTLKSICHSGGSACGESAYLRHGAG